MLRWCVISAVMFLVVCKGQNQSKKHLKVYRKWRKPDQYRGFVTVVVCKEGHGQELVMLEDRTDRAASCSSSFPLER